MSYFSFRYFRKLLKKNLVFIFIIIISILVCKAYSKDYKAVYIQNITYNESSPLENELKKIYKNNWEKKRSDTLTIFLRSTGDFRINHTDARYYPGYEPLPPIYNLYIQKKNKIYTFNEFRSNIIRVIETNKNPIKIKKAFVHDTSVYLNGLNCSIFEVQTESESRKSSIIYYYTQCDNSYFKLIQYKNFQFMGFNEYLKHSSCFPVRLTIDNNIYDIINYDLISIEEINSSDSLFVLPQMEKLKNKSNYNIGSDIYIIK